MPLINQSININYSRFNLSDFLANYPLGYAFALLLVVALVDVVAVGWPAWARPRAGRR